MTGGNLKGDGRQMGATLVVGPNREVLYSFVQRDFNIFADLSVILGICRGTSAVPRQITPAQVTEPPSSLTG